LPKRPDLFIVGAPKSGTTSLYDYLDGHPEIYMSPVKEPIYFAPDMQAGFKHRFTYGVDETAYLDLYADARDEKHLGEASTRYLASHQAPNLIHEFEPSSRIVAILRNPVEMIYALHNERVSHGAEDVVDFESALALDDERRAGRKLPHGSNAMGAVYRDNARFGEQVQRWVDTFGRDRVLVIIFDDFAAETPGQFRRVLEFLEVDPNYQPAEFAVSNASHKSRGGVVRRLFESRLARWGRRKALPAVVGENNAARMARRVRHSRLNRRPNPRPPMRPELVRELQDEFMGDVAHLGRLTGRDLTKEWFGRPSDAVTGEREALVTS
jgi:hypothetical protein